MLPWLPSFPPQAGVSHHSLILPHIPLIHLSAVNSSPHPGITPHSPNSSSQPLHLPGDPCPSLGYVWLCKDPLILIAFRLPRISCFTLGLKCFSLTQTIAPVWGLAPASVQLKAGPILLTLLFPASFLHPAEFYVGLYIFFPLLRYPCPLSAGVLHAALCLKMYS